MTPATTTATPEAPLRTHLYGLAGLLEVHHRLRGQIEALGPAATLRAQDWTYDERSRCWCLYGLRLEREAALAHVARLDVRRWLCWDRGWVLFPDGSTARHPRTAGLVAAARIEHELRARPAEIEA